MATLHLVDGTVVQVSQESAALLQAASSAPLGLMQLTRADGRVLVVNLNQVVLAEDEQTGQAGSSGSGGTGTDYRKIEPGA